MAVSAREHRRLGSPHPIRGTARPMDRHVIATRAAARKLFLRMFPGGFSDARYLAWERDYKVDAHRQWVQEVGRKAQLAHGPGCRSTR